LRFENRPSASGPKLIDMPDVNIDEPIGWQAMPGGRSRNATE
jgi:hypothetical protein